MGVTAMQGCLPARKWHLHLPNNTMNIPPPRALPGRHIAVPHTLVGDEVFPLKCHIMKPHPTRGLTEEQRIFNYRLSRASRVSDKCFGILVNRFAVLGHEMRLCPEVATSVTQACIAVHNFLRTECDVRYAHQVRRPGTSCWQRDLELLAGNRTAASARDVRDELCEYFNSNGAVDRQWALV